MKCIKAKSEMTLRWSRADTLSQVLDGLRTDHNIVSRETLDKGVWEVAGRLSFDVSRAPLMSVYLSNGSVVVLDGLPELLFMLRELLPQIDLSAITNLGPKIKTLLAIATACEGSHSGLFQVKKPIRKPIISFVISFVGASPTHFALIENGHIVETAHAVTLSFSDIVAFIQQNDQLFAANDEMDDDAYMTNAEDAFYYSKVP